MFTCEISLCRARTETLGFSKFESAPHRGARAIEPHQKHPTLHHAGIRAAYRHPSPKHTPMGTQNHPRFLPRAVQESRHRSCQDRLLRRWLPTRHRRHGVRSMSERCGAPVCRQIGRSGLLRPHRPTAPPLGTARAVGSDRFRECVSEVDPGSGPTS